MLQTKDMGQGVHDPDKLWMVSGLTQQVCENVNPALIYLVY